MTKEELNKALECYNRIRVLERLANYKGINANVEWDPVECGLFTEQEMRAIIDEANEKIRSRARAALKDKMSAFEAM